MYSTRALLLLLLLLRGANHFNLTAGSRLLADDINLSSCRCLFYWSSKNKANKVTDGHGFRPGVPIEGNIVNFRESLPHFSHNTICHGWQFVH